jgi:hypothetical protein
MHRVTPVMAAAYNKGHDDFTEGLSRHPAFDDVAQAACYKEGWNAAKAGAGKHPQVGRPEKPSQKPRPQES